MGILNEQIDKDKTLSSLQTKAEMEIQKAQKLFLEKDAELQTPEESLSGYMRCNSNTLEMVKLWRHLVASTVGIIELKWILSPSTIENPFESKVLNVCFHQIYFLLRVIGL